MLRKDITFPAMRSGKRDGSFFYRPGKKKAALEVRPGINFLSGGLLLLFPFYLINQ